MKYESPILRFSSLELVSDLLVDSYNVYSPQDDPSVTTSSIVGTSGIETSQGYYANEGEKPFSW